MDKHSLHRCDPEHQERRDCLRTPPANFNPYFEPAFRRAVLASGLSLGAKLCFEALVDHAGANGLCWPSAKTLGADVGVTERAAKNYIRELREIGLISSIRERTNQYQFHRVDLAAGPPVGNACSRSGNVDEGKDQVTRREHSGEGRENLSHGKGTPVPTNGASNGVIERNHERRRSSGRAAADPNRDSERIEELRAFIRLPDTLGREPDSDILGRILKELGDAPFEDFKDAARRWCKKRRPESYGIFPVIAGDVRKEHEKADRGRASR